MALCEELKQKRKPINNDEFYTKKENVEDIFENIIPKKYLKDKIIYCPCDAEWSEFVKYLKEHKNDIEYKELIYTWDDYNTHYDLFEYADVIITNPPFSKLIKEFIPILNKCKKDFFIFGYFPAIQNYYYKFEDKNIQFHWPIPRFAFIAPNNYGDAWVQYIYITNINVNLNHDYRKRNYKHKNIEANVDGKIIKVFDNIRQIPDDCYDMILVPSVVLLETHRKHFDIIDYKPQKLEYLDGRSRYVRLFAKQKNMTMKTHDIHWN